MTCGCSGYISQVNASEASASVPEEQVETAKVEKAQPSPLSRSDALREALKAEDTLDALESSDFKGITIEGLSK